MRGCRQAAARVVSYGGGGKSYLAFGVSVPGKEYNTSALRRKKAIMKE